MRRLFAIVIAALAFGVLSGVAAYQKVHSQGGEGAEGRWQEIDWPFPRDGWQAGRAFRCDGCTDDLSGTISFIAPQAEYTPPFIYSESTRVKFVFLAESRPPKAQAALLNPGQPVTVTPATEAP